MNYRKLMAAGVGLFLAAAAGTFISLGGGLVQAQSAPTVGSTTATAAVVGSTTSHAGSDIREGVQEHGDLGTTAGGLDKADKTESAADKGGADIQSSAQEHGKTGSTTDGADKSEAAGGKAAHKTEAPEKDGGH